MGAKLKRRLNLHDMINVAIHPYTKVVQQQ